MNEEIKTILIETCTVCGSSEYEALETSYDYEYWVSKQAFDFVICKSCDHVWLKNRPAPSEVEKIYDVDNSNYTNFDEEIGGIVTKIRNVMQFQKVSRFVKILPKDATIIDIGPGNGSLLAAVKQFRPDLKLVGIDVVDTVFPYLNKLGIETVKSPIENIDLKAYNPDLVIMNQVIEHIDHPEKVIATIYNDLKEGGFFVVETPSPTGIDYSLAKAYWGGWHVPRHWNIFNSENLSKLMKDAGFVDVKVNSILSTWNIMQSFRLKCEQEKKFKIAAFFKLNNIFGLGCSVMVDLCQFLIEKKTSNMRIVGQKENGSSPK